MSFHQQLADKLLPAHDVLPIINDLRAARKKIVFTNGCFDILHAGHVDYLSRARDLGDFLVLGLNTDDSVKCLNKAPNRPINDQAARAKVLAALAAVSAIILFDDPTPYELIKQVRPDILVKGDDYQAEKIVGYDLVTSYGGKVTTIPFLPGFSTTTLINKIRQGA